MQVRTEKNINQKQKSWPSGVMENDMIAGDSQLQRTQSPNEKPADKH